jgi:hypothetical protein
MYVIYIADPANFSATTVNNETTFDTQLWLFDAQGKGVVFNDEAVGTNLDRSRIDNSTGCLTGRSAGVYYIAISRYNRDAIGCEEGFIWNSSPARAVRCPDGPESGSRVTGWVGTTPAAGNYEITLTGAFTAPAQSDIPPCPPFDGWDETDNGGGDAGDLPATAQLVSAANAQACQTPVQRIRGRMDADDVDMFVICITDPDAFSASTVGTTSWDTQLWLFKCDGRGVVHNDDNPDSNQGLQSRIDNRAGCIPQRGVYLLAISRYNRDPVSIEGQPLWDPLGQRARGALSRRHPRRFASRWLGRRDPSRTDALLYPAHGRVLRQRERLLHHGGRRCGSQRLHRRRRPAGNPVRVRQHGAVPARRCHLRRRGG